MNSFKAHLTSKEERKAQMLNRVQQSKYEKELANISIEKRFSQHSAGCNKKMMEQKYNLINQSRQRVAQEKTQRRNLEEIQLMAENFFTEQKKRDALAYHRSETADFIGSMTASKLNQLLQTSLPETFIDRMLGQEKARQQKQHNAKTSKAFLQGVRRPRTFFDLIQVLREEGRIKMGQFDIEDKTGDGGIPKVKRRVPLESKLRWRRVFDLMVKKHKQEKEKEAAKHTNEDSLAVAPQISILKQATTCLGTSRHFRGLSLSACQRTSAKPIQRRCWSSVRPVQNSVALCADPKKRIKNLLLCEEMTQLKMRMKLNQYYRSLEHVPKLDANFVSITSF